MVKIAFAGAFATRIAESVRTRLTMPHEIVVGDEAGIVAQLGDVEVLVSLGFTAAMGSAARRLRLLQVPGAGLDRVDRTALPKRVLLANAYGHEAGIAEHVIGAMLCLSRGFVRLDAKMRLGVWESQFAVGVPAPPLWPELTGKTLGILGYGRIGRAVAHRALAFGMRVSAIRRDATRTSEPPGVSVRGPEALDDLLAEADCLAVTLALTDQTRRLLGEKELARMKSSAILINVARAEIIDPAALYRALAEHRIAGAALDVWYRYPTGPGPTYPADLPFHQFANVLMTPHVSGWTEGMLESRTQLIADNIARLAAGQPLINAIG